jgi:hypothetical protein
MAVGGLVSDEQSRNLVRKANEKMIFGELLVDVEDDEFLFAADLSM